MLRQIVKYTFGTVIVIAALGKATNAGHLMLSGAQGYGIAVDALEGHPGATKVRK